MAMGESNFQGSGMETLQHRTATILMTFVPVAMVVCTPSRCGLGIVLGCVACKSDHEDSLINKFFNIFEYFFSKIL